MAAETRMMGCFVCGGEHEAFKFGEIWMLGCPKVPDDGTIWAIDLPKGYRLVTSEDSKLILPDGSRDSTT